MGRIILYLLFLFSFFLPNGLEMNLYKLNICESTVYTHTHTHTHTHTRDNVLDSSNHWFSPKECDL